MSAATARTSPVTETDSTHADRGTLEIHRAVLRKIAEHTADAVPGSVRVRRRIAGVGWGTQGATARLAGPDRELRVRLDVALGYPVPILTTVGTMRERVTGELERLAGCHVHSVEVIVSALVPTGEPSRVE